MFYRERQVHKRLDQVRGSSPEFTYNDNSKIVIMSDCHRGVANWADNFDSNQNIYFAALQYYYKEGFSYIELGDGDELWENRCLDQIITAHSDVYWLLSKFYFLGRLLFVYGNHDRVKQNESFVEEHYNEYYNACEKRINELFPGIKIYEGIRLKHQRTCKELLLVHGHQGDLLNDTLWRLGRFLVRYVWRPLELFGVNDPTSAAKNYRKANKIERRLKSWAKKNDHALITGHTHRPHIPEIKTDKKRGTIQQSCQQDDDSERYECARKREVFTLRDKIIRRENATFPDESITKSYGTKADESDIKYNIDETEESSVQDSSLREESFFNRTKDESEFIPYFNTGSCVHPRCITALEIQNNKICLVKWAVYTRSDNSLYVSCELLDGPVSLDWDSIKEDA